MYPNLGEVVLCRRHPLGCSNMLPSVHQTICSRATLSVGCVCPSSVAGPITVDALTGGAGPPGLVSCEAIPSAGAVGQLEGRTSFLCSWLHGPGWLGAAASQLEGRAGFPCGCVHGPLIKPQVLNSISLLAY